MLSEMALRSQLCSILNWKASFMGEMQYASRSEKNFPRVATKGTCEAFS